MGYIGVKEPPVWWALGRDAPSCETCIRWGSGYCPIWRQFTHKWQMCDKHAAVDLPPEPVVLVFKPKPRQNKQVTHPSRAAGSHGAQRATLKTPCVPPRDKRGQFIKAAE